MKRWTKNFITIVFVILLLAVTGAICWHATIHLPYKIDAINDGTMTIAEAQEHGLDLSRTFTVPYFVLIFFICFISDLFLVYFFMSSFNKLKFKEVFSYKKKYFVFFVTLFASFAVESALTILVGYIFVNAPAEANKINTDLGLKRSYVAEYKADVIYSESTVEKQKTFESDKVDYSTLLISGRNENNLSEYIVNKYLDGTSELNGRNSAIAIRGGNTTSISQIISNTYGNNSPVLYVRNTSSTVIDRFTGNSSGQRSAIVNTNSLVRISHYTFETAGDTTLELVNNGSLYLSEGSILIKSEKSDKNIFVRGTENRGIADLTMANCSVSISGGTLFKVINNNLSLSLSHVGIATKKPLDSFMELNNSLTYLSLSEQAISGKIVLENNSQLYLSLLNGSTFIGSIPESNDSNVNIIMDNTSRIVLTDDMYINSFIENVSLKDHIITNGHSVYVDGVKVL